MNQGPLEKKWLEIDASPQRRAAVERATDCAAWTNPRLFAGYESTTSPNLRGNDYPDLYSNTMATIISTRAGKLTDAVFPPNGIPFFDFSLDITRLTQLVEESTVRLELPPGVQDVEDYVRNVLTQQENTLLTKLQESNYRDILNIAFEHAQVTGDPNIHVDDDYNFSLYHIGQMLIRRNRHGVISDMMMQQWVQTDLLDDELKNMNGGKRNHHWNEHEPYYRHIYLDGDTWMVVSEFRGQQHGEVSEYKVLPYFHIGWNNVAGEDYSRTPVYDHYGAVVTLEMCHKAMAEGAAGSAEWRMRLDPFSQSKPSDIVDTENGAIVLARQGDLEPITVNLTAPLQAIAAYIEMIEARLERAWGISAASTLRGERVTATQVQQATQEVAEADGAILTHVANTLQKQLVRRMVEIEKKKGRLDPVFETLWDAEAITVGVKTGLDALGRQIDAARIQSVLAAVQQFPELAAEINMSWLTRELVRTTGLDTGSALLTEEEKEARAEAQQQRQLAQQAGEQAIKSTGQIVENQATQ